MPNDNDLIRSAQQGQRSAFRDLVRRYQKTAYYFALDLTGNHDDAQDLSQEVFVQIYQSIGRFRGESKFSTWLYRITLNTWSNQKRKRNAKLQALLDPLSDTHIHIKADDRSSSPEKATERALMYDRIQRAARALSPKEKSVFFLRQFQEQKLEAIAEIMGIKVGTVKSLLFRALKKLKKELSVYYQDGKITP
jgi:RNA polymerase sigma-70 factor (ECF subfamily)